MAAGVKGSPRGVSRAASGQVIDQREMNRVARLGLSTRQLELNRLWSYYRCQQYEARKIDWNGSERRDPIETEIIATAGFLPAGFVDVGGQQMPLKFRRPTAPYHLIKVIVDRFTGLLFSEKRHPQLTVEGDEDTEDYANALAKSSRLWAQMIKARQYGGAMGSVAVGFQFVDGRPQVDVHDPRWCIPDFLDRSTHKLRSIEKRYMYPLEERDEQGRWVENWYWYRRIIDDRTDILFEPAKVESGDEPEWKVQKQVEHALGFCPVIWLQNLPIEDDIDGDPDCEGIVDQVETIDSLIAQANLGTLANLDPTLLLITDAELPTLRKGSGNAVKLPAGSSGTYLEIGGAGIKVALELTTQLRSWALEVAQCVLEHPDVSAATATEIERRYESMIAKADILREQYGEKLVKPLVEMMLEAARKFGAPRMEPGHARVGLGGLGADGLNPLSADAPDQGDGANAQEAQPIRAQAAQGDQGGGDAPGQIGDGYTGPGDGSQGVQPQQGGEAFKIVRYVLKLPPRVIIDEETGDVIGKEERKLGEGGELGLVWPSYFEPSLDDATKAAQAAAAAKSAMLIDDEHATKFVAKYFGIENPQAVVEKLRENEVQQRADMAAQAMGGMPPIEEEPPMDENGEPVVEEDEFPPDDFPPP